MKEDKIQIINKTQLSPDKEFERHIFHRDQFAHYLRWSFILRQCSRDEIILDIGCGTANLAETLYRNRYKPKLYIGTDLRKKTLENNSLKKFNFDAKFIYNDLRYDTLPVYKYTKICCFEVLEHFEKKYIDKALSSMVEVMQVDTLLYISTPSFNGKKAQNHVNEYTFDEFKTILSRHFVIKSIYGTFASKNDLMKVMDDKHINIYEALSEYYDNNMMSVIFAPLYAEASRNCMWVLMKKNESSRK